MTGIFNRDFVEFLEALSAANVKYILVSGYAVILHGYHRATGALDVWVESSVENFKQLQQAFAAFGLPAQSISEKNVFRYRALRRIYIWCATCFHRYNDQGLGITIKRFGQL